MRHKYIPFLFEIPVTSLSHSDGLFRSAQVGNLQVCGKGKVIGEPVDSPFSLMTDDEKKWIDISITDVFWQFQNDQGPQEANITLLLRHMKECRQINQAILEAAANQCASIWQEKYAQ